MKISPLFIVISILAILWNIMGIFQMLSAAFPTPEILEKMKPSEIELLDSYPWWLYLFFGAGVFNGTAGSILMLLRKPLATPLFLVSWLGVTIQMAYWLFPLGAAEYYGGGACIMPALVVGVAGFLYFFSKRHLV